MRTLIASVSTECSVLGIVDLQNRHRVSLDHHEICGLMRLLKQT
jgi:hypothetical protein